MKHFHVAVIRDEGWFVGRVLDRPGVTTQGRTLDELVLMLRDAIELMWRVKDAHLELILPTELNVVDHFPVRTRTRSKRSSRKLQTKAHAA